MTSRLALLLPIAAQLLLWALVSAHRDRLGLGRLSARGTLVMAFLVGQVVLVGITEVLGYGHHLTYGGVTLAWLLVTSGLAVTVAATGVPAQVRAWQAGGGLGRTAGATTRSPGVAIGILTLLLIGGTLLYTAGAFVPNNSDALAYHLTRVAHWAQDRSVTHFATHYIWQIQLAPLHEYDLLHLHVLAGTDRLDGLPQLASFVASVLGVAEIVRLLGGRAEVQVLGAVLAATMPSLVLEATSTQNNLFPAAMGMGVVLLALAWEPLQRPLVPALLLGAGVALVTMGKGTAIPQVIPVVATLGVRIVVQEVAASSWPRVVGRLAGVGLAAGLAATVVIGPFWARNLELFGSVNGDVDGTLNDEITPNAAVANSVRNLALQFRIGNGRSGLDTATSEALLPALRRVFEWTGAAPHDGHLDYGTGEDAFELRDYREYERNEDYGASPWFTLLLGACLPVVLVRGARRDPTARTAALLAVGGVVGFLAFSVTTKWTPYGARYLLPLLVLAPPLAALTLHAAHRHLLRIVAIVLVIVGLPSLLDSWARPLFDRPPEATDLDAYVVARPDGDAPLAKAEDFVSTRDAIVGSECERVGVGNWILFEYLLWIGLDHVGWTGEIQHVGPFANQSAELVNTSFEPCAIVHDAWLGQDTPGPDGWRHQVYGSLTLWLPVDGAERAGWGTAAP